jgi:hypothetical protein
MRCTPTSTDAGTERVGVGLTCHGNTYRRDALGWHRMLDDPEKGSRAALLVNEEKDPS